jgi:hypothetical protein
MICQSTLPHSRHNVIPSPPGWWYWFPRLVEGISYSAETECTEIPGGAHFYVSDRTCILLSSWEDPYQALYSNPGSSDLSMVPSAYRTEQRGIRKGGYNGTILIVSNAQSDSPQALTQSRNWTNASTITPRARAPGQVASG